MPFPVEWAGPTGSRLAIDITEEHCVCVHTCHVHSFIVVSRVQAVGSSSHGAGAVRQIQG